jgi:hypothetical protein
MPLAIRRSRSLEAEEVVNEGSLPGDVILSQPPDLSLTNHVHRFRFPELFGSRVEGPESLTRSDPPLAVDLGRTPERVLATHSPNKLAYFLRHGWSSTLTMVTLPCPEQTKSLPLPANDRICLDNHQSPPRVLRANYGRSKFRPCKQMRSPGLSAF